MKIIEWDVYSYFLVHILSNVSNSQEQYILFFLTMELNSKSKVSFIKSFIQFHAS